MRNSWLAKVLDVAALQRFTVATTSWIPDLSSRSLNLASIASRVGDRNDSGLINYATGERREFESAGKSGDERQQQHSS